MSNPKKLDAETRANKELWNRFLLVPVVLSVALLPLLMSEYNYDPKLKDYNIFYNITSVTDFFLHCKQNFFIAMGIIMVFVLICKLCVNRKELQMIPALLPLALYGLMAILSTICSEYRSYSISGSYEQFESIFVLLTYCVIVYYTYVVLKYESDVKFILNALLICILIFSIIGAFQFASHDLLRTNLGKKLYVDKAFWNNLDDYTFQFELNRVYLTLYNPNYVGVYTSLVIPLLISLLYFTRKSSTFILYVLGIAGMGLCLVGSKSTSAIIGIMVALIFLLILLRNQIRQNLIVTIPAVVVCIGVLLAVCIPKSPFYMLNKFSSGSAQSQKLTSVFCDDSGAHFIYNGNTLNVQLEIENTNQIYLNLSDGDGVPVTDYTIDDSGTYTFSDSRYTPFKISFAQIDQLLVFDVTVDQVPWRFTNQLEDNSYHYINAFQKVDDIVPAKYIGFEDNPRFASNRGYIWSRTFPILKDYILVGSGPDTFIFDFPSQDYVMKNTIGYNGVVLTKPHSLYLQISTQTGLISLLAFLTFYVWYFISSMKLYLRSKFENYFEIAGVSIFLGSISYMVTAIANDSSICTSPVFWGLLGVGVTINFKILRTKA